MRRCVDRSDRGRIVVSGADRASYLQGLLTNDVVALKAGQGCYAAYLTAQGRMIADLYVYELGDVMLLSWHGDVKDAVLAKLDQFIFTEDVQLGDVTGHVRADRGRRAGGGARRRARARRACRPTRWRALPEHGNLRARRATGERGDRHARDRHRRARVRRVRRARAGGRAQTRARRRPARSKLDAATAEAIRIEAGVPLFHRDMDEETIPLEAGIESRAISFSKGCYVGQEVIIRVLHRGHGRVARKLVGLRVRG